MADGWFKSKNINTTRRYTCYLACLKMCYAKFYCCHARGGKENTRCPMRNAQRAGAKISHPMRVRGVYFR